MQLLESTPWSPAMRLLPLLFAGLIASTPALALEPQYADGDWDCDLGTEKLGGLNIDGESYRFTRPDGRKRAGDLALELDGVTYYVESGVLRDEFGITDIAYGDEGGADNLTLSTGNLGSLTAAGFCLRPKAS
jgi:hypothetical protein